MIKAGSGLLLGESRVCLRMRAATNAAIDDVHPSVPRCVKGRRGNPLEKGVLQHMIDSVGCV